MNTELKLDGAGDFMYLSQLPIIFLRGEQDGR